MSGATGTWEEIGRSTTSPIENKERKEVKVDEYYVVVGFEVNHPEAFVDNTHDLAVDYGHAFFYVVKNKVVSKFLSFGPAGVGKVVPYSPIKDGYANARPGTPDYGIDDKVKAFKIILTVKQGIKLEAKTEERRKLIISKKLKYTAWSNATCANTARSVLSDAGINTPSGDSNVKKSDVLGKVFIPWQVNPYKWHDSFVKAKQKEVTYVPPSKGWTVSVGDADPIF
jgi:hypothetical protein